MKRLFNLLETVALLFLSQPDANISPASMFCLMKNQEAEGRLPAEKLCSVFGDRTYFRGEHSLHDECERFMSKEWSPKNIDECTLFLDEDLNLDSEGEMEMMDKWDNFLEYGVQYNKVYDTIDEIKERYLIFHDNLAFIKEHNDGNHSYKLGVNQFADWSNDEFKSYVRQGSFGLGMKTTCPKAADMSGNYPSSIDWRQQGIVATPMNQLSYGNCYSFSTTASMEGALAQKTGKFTKLSEQAIVDCAGLLYGDAGNNGGSMSGSFNFIHDNGIPSEADYPYVGKQGSCKKYNTVTSNSGCYEVPANELQITQTLSKRVISIAVQADGRSFQLYKSGVYDDDKCYTGQLDHGVALVGYGHDQESGKDFYYLKNSWGSDTDPNGDWGLNGYMMIKRNSVATSTTGICGLAMMASYPVL